MTDAISYPTDADSVRWGWAQSAGVSRSGPWWSAVRALFLVAGVAFGVAATGGMPANAQESVLLRKSPMVDDKFVRLGDLFINIPDGKRLVAVAHAPSPGKQTEFPVNVLVALAKRHDIGWHPLTIHDRVLVLRASREIGQSEIEDRIAKAVLNEYSIADSVTITLDNPNAAMHLPTDQPVDLTVEKLDLERRSGRFVATVSAPTGPRTAEKMTVSGIATAMVNIPIAATRIGKNDPIRMDDIVFEEREADRLNSRILVDVDDIVGMSPRRSIGAGDTFDSGDLKSVPLVLKGASVALIYQTPMMRLTAQGRSSEEGGLGETVRVTNTQSNRSILGTVVGPNRVMVTTPDMPLQPYTARR